MEALNLSLQVPLDGVRESYVRATNSCGAHVLYKENITAGDVGPKENRMLIEIVEQDWNPDPEQVIADGMTCDCERTKEGPARNCTKERGSPTDSPILSRQNRCLYATKF